MKSPVNLLHSALGSGCRWLFICEYFRMILYLWISSFWANRPSIAPYDVTGVFYSCGRGCFRNTVLFVFCLFLVLSFEGCLFVCLLWGDLSIAVRNACSLLVLFRVLFLCVSSLILTPSKPEGIDWEAALKQSHSWPRLHRLLSRPEPCPQSIFSKYIDTSLAVVSLTICCQNGCLCLDADAVYFPGC